jgi:N-acetylmuramic acid 6-phosphate etherase
MGEDLLRQLAGLATEARNPETEDLDRLDALGIVMRMSAQDAGVAGAVAAAAPAIASVAELAARSFAAGGRLIYLGAGTSGRLGVLDAAECPPTFGTEPEQVIGIIAGGASSMFRSSEGVEDDAQAGRADLLAVDPDPADTVVGISASHRTPWTVGAVEEAERRGCSTAFMTANPAVAVPGRVVVRLLVGPEAITGSTRLKAGSAQKMALNLISSAAMVLSGKIYGNLMVDLRPVSAKLRERSHGMIMALTGLEYAAAAELLVRSGKRVKTALLMELGELDREAAERALIEAQGSLRAALEGAGGTPRSGAPGGHSRD